MIRKFAVALFAVSTLSSSIAMALGLGEANVKSSLNQPLEAEIELVSVRDLGQAEILPALAKPSDFEKAGVERVQFLSDLKFNVVFKDSNKAVIRLTSNRPVREPFLNFLVEVVWPNGRLLREYALLIDPPMFTSDRPAAIAPAATESRPQVSRTPSAPRTVASAPAMNGSASDNASPARTGSSGSYGPTSGADTLWRIADRNRPNSSVSTQQTMLAIQDLNPNAFIGGNINLLKAGQVLRMPELSDVEARTFDQAVSEVRAQNRAFVEKSLDRRQLDSTPNAAPTQTAQRQQGGDELKIVVADNNANQAVPGQPAGSKAGRSAGTGGNSEAELSSTLEQLDKTTRENQELQSRLKDLESQLETLQRLVSLKDDQLASMQGRAAQSANAETADATSSVAPEAAEPQSTAGANEGEGRATDAVTDPAADLTDSEMVEEGETVDPAAVAGQSAQQIEEAAPAQPAVDTTASADAANANSAGTDTSPATQPEPTIIEQILSNPLYQAAAGGGILLILIILWLVSRNNASKEKEFHEQFAAAGGSAADDDEDVLDLGHSNGHGAAAGMAGVAAGAAVGAAAARSDEGEDVISEADVYLAYGRADQAARILETGLEDAPERTDVRLKLLGLYAQAGNVGAFEQHLDALRASGDEDAIRQAEQMQADMPQVMDEEPEEEVSLDDLENQLLTGKSTFEARATADEVDDDEYLIDEEANATPVKTEQTGDSELDDDFLALDEAALMEDDTAPALEESDTDNLDIEFDISELDLDGLEDKAEPHTKPAPTDLNMIEFETAEKASELQADEELNPALDSELEQVPSLTDSAEEDDLDLSELDLDLGAEDGLDLSVRETQPAADIANASLSNELEDLSLDEMLEAAETPAWETEAEEANGSFTDSLAAAQMDGELDAELELPAESLTEENLDADELPSMAEPAAEVDDEVTAEADSLDVLTDEEIAQLEDVAAEADLAMDDMAEPDLDEEDFDFLAGTDEAATKLDLARAYIDMGDAEGARDILEEVAQEGNEQQKQDALSLLKNLA